jgi:hypothetical protein
MTVPSTATPPWWTFNLPDFPPAQRLLSYRFSMIDHLVPVRRKEEQSCEGHLPRTLARTASGSSQLHSRELI